MRFHLSGIMQVKQSNVPDSETKPLASVLYPRSGPSWCLKPIELMERLLFSEPLCY